MEKYATIDLGSNTVRLVIFEVFSNGSYKLVESLSDTVRLGHGLNKTKLLSEMNMQKAAEVIRVFSDFCESYRVPKNNIFAFATAAIRLSENGADFIENLNKMYNFEFHVLSGTEEAMYVFNAVSKTFDHEKGMIIDIGGSSTEIVRFEGETVLGCVSLPYGCVSAAEVFLGNRVPPSKDNIDMLAKTIHEKLMGLEWLKSDEPVDLFGIGGTARAFAKIHMKKTAYPFDKINNYIIPCSALFSIESEIAKSSRRDLENIPGLSPDRRDVILGGLLILKAVCSHISARRIIMSGSGLREGVFLEKMLALKKIPLFDNALNFSLNNFILLYNIRREHAKHVSSLSIQLFRQLMPLHGIDMKYEKHLKTAALIHDAGIYISYYNHNKHSLYLILNSSINGLDHNEQLMVAIAASGLTDKKLREALPENYSTLLGRDDLITASSLALIIRIAEALDKSETGSIESIRCEIFKSKVKMITKKTKEASLEIRSSVEFASDFKKMFKKTIEVT